MPKPRREKPLSRTRTISPVELQVCAFLRGKILLDQASIATLVKLDTWAHSFLVKGLDRAMDGNPGIKSCKTSFDFIDRLADSLIENASGLKKLLLKKSLQETFI